MPPSRQPLPASPPAPRSRTWLWRLLLATAAPLLFFLIAEISFRALGIGQDLSLFIPDVEPGTYRTNPHFTDRFFPAHFDLQPLPARLKKHKDSSTLRVFALGESAVFGTPEPGFGFPTQLRAQLRSYYPQRKVEVINLGITAINSHVVYCIAKELADFDPDLIVIYLGNNEVVGPYGPGSAFLASMPPLPFIRASLAVRRTRVGQWLDGLLSRFAAHNQPEWGGMETFAQNTVRGNDPRLETVYANFSANLRDIVRLAANTKAKVVLSTVVANLKDCPPFISLHGASLPPSTIAAWQSVYDQGLLAWHLGKAEAARTYFEKAGALDPQYAECHYLLGKIAASRGEREIARTYFVNALHWDALRFRPDPQINTVIRQVAGEAAGSVILVDAAKEMGSDAAPSPVIAGHETLWEHVHFNWEGNFTLARWIAEAYFRAAEGSPSGHGLDAKACAAAVGYTPCGELTMLSSVGELTSGPPFTRQLDFAGELTRQSRERNRLQALLSTPDALRTAAAAVEQAKKNDRENPYLPVRGAEISYMMGDFPQSLRYVEEALAQTPSAYLLNKKGTLLLRQGQLDEAEKTFLQSLTIDPHFLPVCTGLEEIWVRTHQLDRGRIFFEAMLKQYSWNHFLRVTYSDFLLRVGDTVAAETQCRLVLTENPGDIGALERLINILNQTNQMDKVLETMQIAFPYQKKNFDNNLRLARYFESRHDYANAALYFEAATESAPINAAAEITLAQHLLKLNQSDDAITHLFKAREIATFDGDAQTLKTVKDLINRHGPQ